MVAGRHLCHPCQRRRGFPVENPHGPGTARLIGLVGNRPSGPLAHHRHAQGFQHLGLDLRRVIEDLARDYPFLTPSWAERMIRHYGLEARDILGAARSVEDLGQAFGATLYEAEVRWLMEREWARGVKDVIWRRTKLGLRMTSEEIAALEAFMAQVQQG